MRKMVAWETVSLLNARSKAKVEDVSKPTRTGEGRGKARDKGANPISRPNRGAHRGSSKAKDKARHKLRVLLSARQMLNSRGKAVLLVRVVPPTRPVPVPVPMPVRKQELRQAGQAMRAVVPRVTALRVVVGALEVGEAHAGTRIFAAFETGFSSARRLCERCWMSLGQPHKPPAISHRSLPT